MKPGSEGARKIAGWWPYLLLAAVWAVLYLPHLRTSPGWYGDETLTHHTSLNLVSGTASNFSLWNTFWHPHYPYQPFYSLVNGVCAWLFGGDILGSRLFNALLALASAFVFLGWGRRSFGFKASFFAACMFLTYDQSVLHFRMSYAHNAVGLGFLILTLSLLRPPGSKSDWAGGLGLLMGAGAHPLFIHGALAGFLCRITKPRSWVRLFLPAAACVFVSLAAAYIVFGTWLVEDLLHLKNIYTGRGQSDGNGWRGLFNFGAFLLQDWFHFGLFLGLLACIPLRKHAAPVVGFLVLFLLVRNRGNLILFYYQAIIILPVLCLGWAGLWRYAELRMRKRALGYRRVVMVLGIFPFLLMARMLPPVLRGELKPRNDYWVTQSAFEVEKAARWLNERTGKGDVVGGNANIAWLLEAETVPYLQMVTWYGWPTQGYENGNAKERFRYDASLENCKYAVIGDIDQRWTFQEPNVMQLLQKMKHEQWPVVWQGEYYYILKNPAYP